MRKRGEEGARRELLRNIATTSYQSGPLCSGPLAPGALDRELTSVPVCENSRRGQCFDCVPRSFLIIGALLGILYAFVVPPFQVPDENRHLWRAYGISDLDFIPQSRTQVPLSFLRLSERFSPRFERTASQRVVRLSEIAWWLGQSLRSKVTEGVENPNANLYSLVPYIPAALVLWGGRAFECSPLSLLYAGRLLNAGIYLALVYYSLRILPDFKLLLLTIALSPMSLQQAASLSADSLTLGLTAMLTALIFKLSFNHNVTCVRMRDRLIIVVLLALVALCKFNLWTALLAFLIPGGKFGSQKGRFIFAGTCLVAVCLVGGGWHFLNQASVAAFTQHRLAEGKWTGENAAFIVNHPLMFVGNIITTDALFGWIWVNEFVGLFGWLSIPMNPVLVVSYAGVMLLAACTTAGRIEIARHERAVLGTFVLLTFISLHVLLWIFETTTRGLHDALTQSVPIAGIQGRYFLPLALPALAIVRRHHFRLQPSVVGAVLAIVVIVNGGALVTIWRVYC